MTPEQITDRLMREVLCWVPGGEIPGGGWASNAWYVKDGDSWEFVWDDEPFDPLRDHNHAAMVCKKLKNRFAIVISIAPEICGCTIWGKHYLHGGTKMYACVHDTDVLMAEALAVLKAVEAMGADRG